MNESTVETYYRRPFGFNNSAAKREADLRGGGKSKAVAMRILIYLMHYLKTLVSWAGGPFVYFVRSLRNGPIERPVGTPLLRRS